MERCKEIAKQIRIDSVKMTNKAKSGHVGSMLSMADMIAVLYEKILNVDPKNPKMENRDRFILSKGYAAAAVYSALAQKGFIPAQWLERYHCDDGKLMGHISHKVPGVEFSTGPLGMSHHSTEDISIIRALPNMVVVPCDNYEAEAATHAMIEYDGPLYYHCGYKGEKDIHNGPVDFKIGKAITVRDGKDVTLMFAGPVGLNVLHAADILEKEGISCRIVSMHTIKPIDKEAIKDAAENTGGIITIEEHNLSGGLGGAVSEVICDEGLSPKVFKRIALPDVNVALIGHQEWIREQFGMNAEGIANQIRESLK